MNTSIRKITTTFALALASITGVVASATPSSAAPSAAVVYVGHAELPEVVQSRAIQQPATTGILAASSVRPAAGFKAQLWSYTVADPSGFSRIRYFIKCNPKKNVREFRMHTSWIYTTYECWAILA